MSALAPDSGHALDGGNRGEPGRVLEAASGCGSVMEADHCSRAARGRPGNAFTQRPGPISLSARVNAPAAKWRDVGLKGILVARLGLQGVDCPAHRLR
jgi:hypothetical protein